VTVLPYQSLTLWLLGHPEAALAGVGHGLKEAREIAQAATMMLALAHTSITHIFCGNDATANALADELVGLADAKGAFFWKAHAMSTKGSVVALTGKAADAAQMIASGITAWPSTGATVWMPLWLSCLTRAYAAPGQLDDAWRCIGAAMTAVDTTKERWCEAEVHRVAGEIAVKSPEPDAGNAEAYFELALAVAREQQAKSWEFRAAMNTARLWCDRTNGTRLAIFSPQSMVGPLKASTRLT
jgi:predicted ATPase